MGSSTPLPPVKTELSSKKSSKRDRHELPTAARDGTRTGRRHDAVELELVIVRRVGRAVAVVVLLEVDLQRVVLTCVGVDPEVEVFGAGQINRARPPESTVEAWRAARTPAGLERERPAERGREVRCVRRDSAAADRTVEREPAVAQRVAVLHVVEHHGIERSGSAGRERDLVEVDLDVRRRAAHDAAEHDDHLVDIAVEHTVAARATVEEAAQRGTQDRPLVVELCRRERRVEPDRILEPVRPTVAVGVFSHGEFEVVLVDRGVALPVHPHVEPRIGRQHDLAGVGKILEGPAVETAR